MALTISEANAVNVILRAMLGQEVEPRQLQMCASLLAGKAHKTLGAGLRDSDVNTRRRPDVHAALLRLDELATALTEELGPLGASLLYLVGQAEEALTGETSSLSIHPGRTCSEADCNGHHP
jgi:hypothetical protein